MFHISSHLKVTDISVLKRSYQSYRSGGAKKSQLNVSSWDHFQHEFHESFLMKNTRFTSCSCILLRQYTWSECNDVIAFHRVL